MGRLEVGTLELWAKPEWFRIGDRAQIARLWLDDFGLFSIERADAQVRVLGQYLLAMEIVEGGRCIGTGNLF